MAISETSLTFVYTDVTKSTALWSPVGNGGTRVHTQRHVIQPAWGCVSSKTHCVYLRNVVYVTYSCGLVTVGVRYSLFSQSSISAWNTFHSDSKQQIYAALAFPNKSKPLQHTQTQTIVS